MPIKLFIGIMTTHIIKEGAHYDNKILSASPWLKSVPSIKYQITFSADCQYTLPTYYQDNVNKLFGLQFGFKLWKDHTGAWDVGVHWNSARFGWRWSETDQCIELLAYSYYNGVRNWDAQMRFPVVAQVKLGDTIELEIVSTKDSYMFYSEKKGETKNCFTMQHGPQTQWFGLTHGLMFGGSVVAPHIMHVEMKRI